MVNPDFTSAASREPGGRAARRGEPWLHQRRAKAAGAMEGPAAV